MLKNVSRMRNSYESLKGGNFIVRTLYCLIWVGHVFLPSSRRQWIKECFFRLTRIRPRFCRRLSKWGLNDVPRSPKVIVSLTSYPKRIGTIHRTIETLLTQDFRPDMVVLWLAKDQFPNGEADLPRKLLNLKAFGLMICWCEDIRSYKKLIPALREYPEDVIVTADDDLFYRPDWLGRLFASYQTDSDAVHCHFANDIRVLNGQIGRYSEWLFCGECGPKSFRKALLGGAGGLYPPHILAEDVMRSDLFMKLAPCADDLWFWAMAVLNNKKVKLIDNAFRRFECDYAADNSEALQNHNLGPASMNDSQLSSILKAYPIVKERLLSEV